MAEDYHRIYHGAGRRKQLKGFKVGENAYLVKIAIGSRKDKDEDDYKILEVLVEKSGRKYVHICCHGIFVRNNGCDFLRPENLYSIGRQLFPTREAAERGIERMKMIKSIRDYVNAIGAFYKMPLDDLKAIYKILGGKSEED